MALDVCPPFPAERSEVEEACRLSAAWAARGRARWTGPGLVFGIVQGGTHEDLRRRAAPPIVDLDFDGYAIGGVAVGEPKEAIRAITESTAPLLPDDKPRYLMGVGTPADLLASVRAGVDLFDCVLPTRHGRMGHAYTREGEVTIKHARYREDLEPLDGGCACPVCRRHSRAYLRHLFVAGDFSAPMLLSIHNVYFYLEWMRRIRAAIRSRHPRVPRPPRRSGVRSPPDTFCEVSFTAIRPADRLYPDQLVSSGLPRDVRHLRVRAPGYPTGMRRYGFSWGGRPRISFRKPIGDGVCVSVARPERWRATSRNPHAIPTDSDA